MQNLLAQRKEIQRLEKEDLRRKGEEEQVERERGEEERERAVRDFEAGRGARSGEGDGEGRVRKRKAGFEIDEGEMRRGLLEERKRVRREIDEEKVYLPPSLIQPHIQSQKRKPNLTPTGRKTHPPLLLGPLPHALHLPPPLHIQTPKTASPLPRLLPNRHPSPISENPHHAHVLH